MSEQRKPLPLDAHKLRHEVSSATSAIRTAFNYMSNAQNSALTKTVIDDAVRKLSAVVEYLDLEIDRDLENQKVCTNAGNSASAKPTQDEVFDT